jgi:formylglycine-generating enzyme required for sulfatase activity
VEDQAHGKRDRDALVPAGGVPDGVAGDGEVPLGRRDPAQAHDPQAFYLSQTEVPKAEWRAIAGTDPGDFKGDALPIEKVSWNGNQEDFVAPSRGFFRLPSEAEWEYACRAGTTTEYSFGDTITTKQARFDEVGGPVACGSFAANPWGFHDMHGNI